ncbi:MAG TPA: 2-oxoglutarate dehydrogenase E1 component [Terriglobales bacterium]|nr:2-oxoglutarate dehydrogenase E1 component [Terriglobales bacterium]
MSSARSPFGAVSALYIESLEAQYWRDPASIDPGWRHVFDVLRDLDATQPLRGTSSRLSALVHWFRRNGHLHARINPLVNPLASVDAAPDMEELWTFIEGELEAIDRAAVRFQTGGTDIELLRQCYADGLAIEAAHIDDAKLTQWLFSRFEEMPVPDAEARKRALRLVVAADEFEAFMAVKFSAKKRFGIEGGELVLPVLDRIIGEAVKDGVTDIVIGTMHRGRLNLLGNVLGKDLRELFAEFKGLHPFPADMRLPADVPYHLGLDHQYGVNGHAVRMTICANPSHLEAVNPVALGLARARQDRFEDRRRVLPIILHTDASVAAQGVVAECLQLAGPAGFSVGGTVHIVINNQIGFTTEPDEARTSRYCTGPWKAIDSLILHVNGDRLDAGLKAADLAVAFRQSQNRDAVIDINCYRRGGHNEIDEPRFTQPLLYKRIDNHPTLAMRACDEAIGNDLVSSAEVDERRMETKAALQNAFAEAGNYRPNAAFTNNPPANAEQRRQFETGIDHDRLQLLLTGLAKVPTGFSLEPKIDKILRQRAIAAETGIGWPLAEALALGSILLDGTGIRFTGQDIVRGAFSHRHFAISDIETGERHLSLNHLARAQAQLEVINSPLSEYGVLGFEYGYSLERPDRLVMWEAQFGDFANGAQIILDQFIFSGRAKWDHRSALVVLLPHGLEGQGPEHSSARPERLLQMAANDHVEIAHPSTPANYFHLLRRQVGRVDPKPLFILSAKSLLRHPAAISTIDDFAPGTAFRPVIAANAPKRHAILCSGKIAYELERAAAQSGQDDVGVIRLEMLYPFPATELAEVLCRWRPTQVTWVQEEPVNMGAWNYLDRKLEKALSGAGLAGLQVRCIARPESSSPAGSFHIRHDADQQELIAQALAPDI